MASQSGQYRDMAMPASTFFFWRETEPDHGFLCQMYLSNFTDPATQLSYNCAEQYMMHQKCLKGASPPDHTTAALILRERDPNKQKYLAREKIRNWNEKNWVKRRFAVVEEGNYLKFCQNQVLKQRLLATGERELVEAAPNDRIWGVGFTAAFAEENREKWGQNLLGKALMTVRERLREEGERKLKATTE